MTAPVTVLPEHGALSACAAMQQNGRIEVSPSAVLRMPML